jgi:TRAP-type mannitol/chloroaromatic compound transport system permease small subunit
LTPAARLRLRWPNRREDRIGKRVKFGRVTLHGATRGDVKVGALLGVSRVIDAVNYRVGKAVAWLIFAAVAVSAVNAIIRKLFDTSSNAWLELQWVLFGAVFLICASWTLLANEHIRIDIVNSMFSQRTRNIIDVVGHTLFLLPLTIIMIITSYPFVMKSVALNEQSMNAGGLPQWPAKMLVLIGFVLLFFQALSELIKRIAVMMGRIPDPYASSGGVHAAAEAEVERLLAEAKPTDIKS